MGIIQVVGAFIHQVGSNNGIQAFRLQHHASSHSINKHLVNSDIREIHSNGLGNLIPENHTVALSIALSDNSQELTRTLLGGLKSEAHNSLNTVSGEDGDLSSDFPRLTSMRAATLAGVLALAVLTNNNPVKVTVLAVAQRRLSAAEDSCWADIGVLLEGLANGQAETPQRDVIGDV